MTDPRRALVAATPSALAPASRLAARTLAERAELGAATASRVVAPRGTEPATRVLEHRSDQLVVANDGSGDLLSLRDAIVIATRRIGSDHPIVRIMVRSGTYRGGFTLDIPIELV